MIRAATACLLLAWLCACTSPARVRLDDPLQVSRLDDPTKPFVLQPEERELWDRSDDLELELAKQELLLEDETLESYLNRVALNLLEHPLPQGAPTPRVRVMRVPERNAMSLANGTILVTLGHLCAMANEAQLASLLGHELGHLLARDALREKRFAARSSSTVDRMALSRQREQGADDTALRLMMTAGYDPNESPAELELLRQEERMTRPVYAAWSSHPDLVTRIDSLWAKLGSGPILSGRTEQEAYETAIADHLLEAAMLDMKRDQLVRARQAIDRYLRIRPESGRGYYLLAEHLRRAEPDGDASPKVLEAYERAAGLDPDDADIQRAVGLLYRGLGRTDAARGAFHRYLHVAPEAPDRGIIEGYLEEAESAAD